MKQTNIYKKYISTIWFACVMIFFSQPILAQDITLQLKNVTVKEAIEALHKTKNYSVVIKSAEINMSKKVSVNATNAPIKAVLWDRMLATPSTGIVSLSVKSQIPVSKSPVRKRNRRLPVLFMTKKVILL